MKKALILLFVAIFTTLFATGAFAGWKLYDDFDSYVDIADLKASGKWFISAEDEAIANFSIENNSLRIEHIAGNPDDSAWAVLINNANKIKGIRATMEVESWEGDVRVRIGADIGVLSENSDNLVWLQMQLRSRPGSFYEETVRGSVSVFNIPTDYSSVYDLFYTELGAGKNLVAGVPYTIETKWSKKQVYFSVKDPDDIGNVKFKIIEKINYVDEPFRAIGTRSSDDNGTCVVYIDDVYVIK